jgi:hypothetical protein
LQAPVDQQYAQACFRQIAAEDQPMMAGANDDAIVGFFQSLGHTVLPPMFCDAENSKFPSLRTQIFAWPYCSTPVFVIASESEAIQVSQRSVDCFVAFAPRSDADMLLRRGEGRA